MSGLGQFRRRLLPLAFGGLAVLEIGCEHSPKSNMLKLSIQPESFGLVVQTSQEPVVTLRGLDGLDTVSNGIVWNVTSPDVARIEAGRVIALSPGTTRLEATFAGFRATSQLTVTPIPRVVPATGPLRVSQRNPRYFETPDGTIRYLTGSHTWNNLVEGDTIYPPRPFDYPRYLAFLRAHGLNFFRLWAWENATGRVGIPGPYYHTPLPYARTGPGSVLDGRLRFDLTRFDSVYFHRLRTRVQEAGAQGIYVSVMLFNGFSVSTKGRPKSANPWEGHPYNVANNVNGIDGDINGDGEGYEVHTLEQDTIVRLQEAYVRAVVDAVNDLDNVLYEISNESDAPSLSWQEHFVEFIRAYEATKPKQHPIGRTVVYPDGHNVDLFASSAEWISPNGGTDDPDPARGIKVIIDDTDHLCGICGDVGWVWKSLTRGRNPVLMDGYMGQVIGAGALAYDRNDPVWEDVRRNLGYARIWANRMDLAEARPLRELASTGYCLAVPGRQYLVFVPGGGPVRVSLTATTDSLDVEWFSPATNEVVEAGAIAGGGVQELVAPFGGDAVLFLEALGK